jgi:murein DD-endopeptidase MepM/ murein hydrolase activator NlpD
VLRVVRGYLSAAIVALLAFSLPGADIGADVHALRSELAEAKVELRVANASGVAAAPGGSGVASVPGVFGASARHPSRIEAAEHRVGEVAGRLEVAIAGAKRASVLSGLLDQVRSLMLPPRDLDTAGRLRPPLRGVITSGFGPRRVPSWGQDNMHNGIDIFALSGAPVTAAADGVVLHVGYRPESGLSVVIDHGRDGKGRRLHTVYSHLSTTAVQRRQQVEAGAEVGAVGNTGTHSTGPHLHFEVRLEGEAVDPRAWL